MSRPIIKERIAEFRQKGHSDPFDVNAITNFVLDCLDWIERLQKENEDLRAKAEYIGDGVRYIESLHREIKQLRNEIKRRASI